MSGPARAAQILLLLFGVGFIILGLRYFADPHALTAESNVAVPDAKAVMEIRTVYGGMFFGLGLSLLVMAVRRELRRAGLWLLMLVAGSVAVARLIAIALGQAPDLMFASLLGIELVGVAIAAYLLRAVKAGC
ncbi:MAG TPA: DUF4345 domain-containing protein [Sphingomicrobium sp.]